MTEALAASLRCVLTRSVVNVNTVWLFKKHFSPMLRCLVMISLPIGLLSWQGAAPLHGLMRRHREAASEFDSANNALNFIAQGDNAFEGGSFVRFAPVRTRTIVL